MPGVFDADTHIAESEAMWGYIEKEMYPRRPVLAKIPEDTWYQERNAFWLIDGEIFPKPAGKASFSLITPSAQKKESGRGDIHLAVREMTDPFARLKDMDKIGVEIQVELPGDWRSGNRECGAGGAGRHEDIVTARRWRTGRGPGRRDSP